MHREFPVGDDVEVVVLDVEEGGRRIRLARKGVQVQSPQRPQPTTLRQAPRKRVKPAAQPTAKAPADPPKSRAAFGSLLADKLKAALDQPGSS